MTKDEIRRNYETRMTKQPIRHPGPIRHSGFGFLSSFSIRISSFLWASSLVIQRLVQIRLTGALRELGITILALHLGVALFGAASSEARAAELYREPYRPQLHFTPGRNWMNDPNGCFTVFIQGRFKNP